MRQALSTAPSLPSSNKYAYSLISFQVILFRIEENEVVARTPEECFLTHAGHSFETDWVPRGKIYKGRRCSSLEAALKVYSKYK
jgi:hypothetical protein